MVFVQGNLWPSYDAYLGRAVQQMSENNGSNLKFSCVVVLSFGELDDEQLELGLIWDGKKAFRTTTSSVELGEARFKVRRLDGTG